MGVRYGNLFRRRVIEEVERIGKSEMLIKTKTGALLVDIKHIKTIEKENKVKYECKKKKV